jgi:hypothetical protein
VVKRLLHTAGGKLVPLLWKAVWRFLKNLKIELPYDLAILLLVMYLKEPKAGYNIYTCIPMFTVALFIAGKFGIHPRCPSTRIKIKT